MSHYTLIQRRAERRLMAVVGTITSVMLTTCTVLSLAIIDASADIVRILVTVN